MITYKFEKTVKRTNNQVKKHFTQFTNTEKAMLKVIVSQINPHELEICNHAKNHVSFLNANFVKMILDACEVIEFNITNGSPRILVRSKRVMKINNGEKANICLVVDLKSNCVITSYMNTKNDKHETINFERYTHTLDIVKIAISA